MTDYDGDDDFGRSYAECLRAVRERVAAGGTTWRPNSRPVFTIRLRPEPGTDAVRAIRGLLKLALRRFRLRCLSIEEQE